MKQTLLLALSCLTMLATTARADDVKVTIEESGLTYRIRISPGTNTVYYDQRSFDVHSPGLCPGGAVAYLKTDKGTSVNCNNDDRGYSSVSMSSTIVPTNNYVLLTGTNGLLSKSYETRDILTGLNQCAPLRAIKAIRKIQLGFNINLRINGVEQTYNAKTEWAPISPDFIRALK